MSAVQQAAIKAAMGIAKDVAEGKINPDDLDTELAATCRQLFGTVAGPTDPLFELQLDVARQVLAAGGMSADELAEWLAVARRRADPPNGPTETDSSGSGPLSPESDQEGGP